MRTNIRKKTIFTGILISVLALVTPQAYPATDPTYEQLKLLVDIFSHVKEQYVQDVPAKDLVYGAAKGMVSVLDPFSQFMEPEAKKDMETETEGKFGGVGMRVAVRDEWLTVITPLPDTPAYRLGILPGDKIIKIEGISTKSMSLTEAVQKLRGEPKTEVHVTIAREGQKELLEFKIIRENIKIQSVKSKLLEGNIGYIKLIEFIEPSTRDMLKAINDLKTQGMTSLVLDLRNNPGGLLSSAVEVSKLFIGDSKLIVYTEGRAQPRQEYLANPTAPCSDVSMVVLVNQGSASGSEILAGALQDHHRALILGSQTFGKGSVQSVITLEDGSGLRLTTAKYYTPAGRSIHRDEKTGKGGIDPDIVVDVTPEIAAKLQSQSEELYAKGKEPESQVKKDERIRDEAMERAFEILKATEIFEKRIEKKGR